MLKELFQNKFFLFFLKAFGIYIIWYLVYEIWLRPTGEVDSWITKELIHKSSYIIKKLGYIMIPERAESDNIKTIGIDGSHGVWIGAPCNGLSLFALFTGFIIAFDGKIKHKLWFIPIGVISIHFLNILRVTALCIIQKYDHSLLDFNHTYTFTIVSYSWIFFLWIIWANKLSKI